MYRSVTPGTDEGSCSVAIVSCEPPRSGDHVAIMDLTGRIILVVEDEPVILLDVTSRLEADGAHVLAAGDLERALVHADHPHLSAAVLDFDLGRADTTGVCWKLTDRRIPFLFHTGRVYDRQRSVGRQIHDLLWVDA